MMTTTLDRRHGERARIPCNIPVELTDDSRQALPFEADAVDLSVGGLSLRAPMLPEVGSHLFCCFEAMPGGAQVLGRGEVVWTQPSDAAGGEFGLRFVELDAKAQALIDEMVAERIARIDTPFAGNEPVLANLEIENVDSPIAARLMRSSGGEALFEQPLDLLTIGRAVVAHAGVSLVRGSLARVDLRMDGATPMLALTVKLEQDTPRFGEFDWDGMSPDTEPDLLGPAGMIGAPENMTLAVGAEAGRGDMPREAFRSREGQLSLEFPQGDPAQHEPHDQESEDLRLALEEDPDEPALDLPLTAASQAARVSLNYRSTEPDAWAQPAPDANDKTWLVSVLRIFAAVLGFLQQLAAPLLGVLSRLGGARQRIVQGANRMVTRARPRRTTSAAGRDSAGKNTLRVIGLGVMSLLAVVLFVYALTPTDGDGIALHRHVVTDGEDAVSTITTAAPVGANEASRAEAVPAGGAQPSAAAILAAGVVPSGSPYAVDLRRGASAKAAPASGPGKPVASATSFGHKQVPNAKRFVLHMSAPVDALSGSADHAGFSISVPSSRAVMRAAPIAEGNPNVAHAMVLNHNDGSQLSVRFAPGKSPAYRVTAQGSTLEVLIGL